MMGLLLIYAASRAQAAQAAAEQKQPLIVEAEDKQSGDRLAQHLKRIPNIGTYQHPAWTLVRTLRVRRAGFGGRNEDDQLTFVQFLGEAKVDHAYAIIDGDRHHVGEFVPRKAEPPSEAKHV